MTPLYVIRFFSWIGSGVGVGVGTGVGVVVVPGVDEQPAKHAVIIATAIIKKICGFIISSPVARYREKTPAFSLSLLGSNGTRCTGKIV